jgi:hypothetical protein
VSTHSLLLVDTVNSVQTLKVEALQSPVKGWPVVLATPVPVAGSGAKMKLDGVAASARADVFSRWEGHPEVYRLNVTLPDFAWRGNWEISVLGVADEVRP